MKHIFLLVSTFLGTQLFAQNVGINATGAAPVSSAALDVDMANKGVLIPRVALTTTGAFAPVTGVATTSLLVFNTATAGAGATAVTPGYYYWDGAQWVRMIGGTDSYWRVGTSVTDVNQNAGTRFIGTTTNQHMDYVTNGVVRGRFSNLGEFFVGTTNTVLAGDLMNGVGNSTFPWAVNGYSSFNGSGVYGRVDAGTTIFAAVQGEYAGAAGPNTAAVRGGNQSAIAGTGFRTLAATGPRVGVMGNTSAGTGTFTFGVHGSMGTTAVRSGAIFGDDFGFAFGGLGYYASNLVDYAVYGFGLAYQVGIAGGKGVGKSAITVGMDQPNTMIGLGIYGGVMGGWMRGMVYGTYLKGERFSLYVDGKTYANEPITQLVKTEGEDRQAVYTSAAMKVEISERGKATLANGELYIPFSDAFKSVVLLNPDEMTITVSPLGNSNGLYIAFVDSNGFTVKENNQGSSNVNFNWVVIATRKDAENMQHSDEVIANDFDSKMDGVMYNDNNMDGSPQHLWWDGSQVRWDAAPAKQTDPQYNTVNRDKKTVPSTVLPINGAIE